MDAADFPPTATIRVPVINELSHECVCEDCQFSRAWAHVGQERLEHLRSAVSHFLSSKRDAGDQARLAYVFELTNLDWLASAHVDEPNP